MVVAGLLGHFMLDGPARGLEVEQRDHRVEQRHLDPLALARFLAFEQRGHDAQRAVEACRRIRHRTAGAHRAAARLAGDRHQPAHALGHLVETRALGIGAALAEAGNAGEDDLLVDLFQRLVIDAETVLDVGPVVLGDDVGFFDELHENLQAVRILQVQREAALVAVQVLEVGAGALAAPAVGEIESGRRLDLDDVGAPVGELAHCGGTGTHAGQVDYTEARQRAAALGACIHRGVSLENNGNNPEMANQRFIKQFITLAFPLRPAAGAAGRRQRPGRRTPSFAQNAPAFPGRGSS